MKKTEPAFKKIIVFTMGGKGGVGKTTFANLLLDFYASQNVNPIVFDCDTEAASGGGLSSFRPDAIRVNIDRRDGLDRILEAVEGEPEVIFADFGARSSTATFTWFDDVYDAVKTSGIAFLSIGLVTDDAASVQSVIDWSSRLANSVRHLIVLNKQFDPQSEFLVWHRSQTVQEYIALASPKVIILPSINPDLQTLLRKHTDTIASVARTTTKNQELRKLNYVIRAQSIDKSVTEQLLPIIDTLLP